MARIFRQTYTKPIPAGAETISQKGRQFARWKDRGGTHTAPLSDDGKRIVRQAEKWYIEYRDASGAVRKVAGYTDKQASVQKAATLERQAAQEQTGLIDRYAEHRKRPLTEHVDDWRGALLAKGNTETHTKLVTRRALAVMTGCGARYWSDIAASAVESRIADLRQQGLSIQTCNFYRQAIKQFCRWMVADGRAPDSPLAYLSAQNVRTDRRHDRRAFEDDELRRVLDAAKKGPVRNGMPGPERAVLYQLSAETGLRASELHTLRWGRADLAADRPTITVKAAYSKHRRDDIQPLAVSTAEMLARWRQQVDADGSENPVFPHFKEWTKTATILRADLQVARDAWLNEAADKRDREKRESADFLKYEDRDGRVADFHALRHTFITNLVRGGVNPKVAQQLARHSTITLTMDRYTHTLVEEQADALKTLPDLGAEDASQGGKTAV